MLIAQALGLTKNISSETTVLQATFVPSAIGLSDAPIQASARIDLDNAFMTQGYTGRVYVNNQLIAPDVVITAPVARIVLQSRDFIINPGDVITITILGSSNDVAAQLSSYLISSGFNFDLPELKQALMVLEPQPIVCDPLCTQEQVATMWGLDPNDAQYDALINQLIPQVSKLITKKLNRPFILASNAANPITEYLDGANSPWLILKLWPVQLIVNIWECDYAFWGSAPNSFQSSDQLTSGTDYALRIDAANGASRSAMVLKLNDVWRGTWTYDANMLSPLQTSGYGNIKVQYVYGFNEIPDDLNLAALLVMGKVRQARTFGSMPQTQSYEEYAMTLLNDPAVKLGFLGGEIAAILAEYRITSVVPFGM